MQRFFFLFFCFIVSFSFGQQVKTQKDILKIPNTDLVTDFNLKAKGNIKPKTVIKATYTDIGFGYENKSFSYLKKDYSTQTLTFEGNKLTSNINTFQTAFGKPNGFHFYYAYDEKGMLKSSRSKSSNTQKLDENEEINEYRFFPNGLIKENNYVDSGKTKTENYSYTNNRLSYNFANGNTTYHLKNGLVTKEVTFNKSANKTYTKSYSYNDQGFLVLQQGETSKYSFQLNTHNLIEKEVTKNYTKHYKYVYDKYGNWIIAYTLSKGTKGLYGSRFNFYLREIEYSNGAITGGKSPENQNIKSALLQARQQLYDELILGKKPYVSKKISNLDLGFPLMEIEEDYGLRIGEENIIPVQLNKKQYDQRKKVRSSEWITILEMESVTDFDAKLQKVKTSKVTRKGTTTQYNFTYDAQGTLKKYWSEGGRYGDRYENYSYEGNGGFTRTTSFEADGKGMKDIYKKTADGYVISGQSNQKIYVENNLVKKKVIGYNTSEPSESLYTHNDQGKLIKLESSFSTIIKKYNANGDLQFMKETNKRDGNYTSRNYVYTYDQYGNWIIQMKLLDMSIAKGIPSYGQPTLRQIKYSNGKVTGTTDITKVATDLEALRKKVRAMDSDAGTQIATWKKMKADNFYLYINNKPVQKAVLSYMGDHILAFIQDNNQLYILENVKNAAINTTNSAKKVDVETAYGYWYKRTNGSVAVFKNNGVLIQKSSLYKYAPNNMDVFYQGEGETKKIVLKNYKNVQAFTVYAAIDFNAYDAGETATSNTVAKRDGSCLRGDCDNGYGEFKYTSNGKIAKGFFSNGQPYGPMLTESSNIKDAVFSSYAGSFQKQAAFTYEFDGKNTVFFYDKNKTKGFMNDSKNQKTYELIFKNGKPVSKKLLKYNGETGCMLGNCSNGIGVYKYSNGAYYFGTFRNGKRSGFGKLDFSNNTYYIGEFSNGDFSGLGSYTWSEDNFYMGEYRNGKYHGTGVMYYNKVRYDAGTWINGKFQGKTTSNKTVSSATSSSSSSSSSNSTSTSTFNIFSTAEKSSINTCNNDSKCVAKYFSKLYQTHKDKLSSNDLTKKMTNYFHSLYSTNPQLAYNICFKMDRDTFNSINIKSLPQTVQDDLKNRAQKLMNGYQEHVKKQGY